MKRGILAAILFCFGLSVAWGEVVIEYDGEKWIGEFDDPNFDKKIAEEGLCILADGKVPVGDVLKDWNFDLLQPHPIRFAMQGIEGKGAVIDSAKDLEGEQNPVIAVICTTKGLTAFHFIDRVRMLTHSEVMNVDFEGVDKFLEVLKNGVVDLKKTNEIPIAVLAIRSKCSYELMVRTLQLIRSSGCKNIVIKVDDQIPDLSQIEVITDPNVLPPIRPAKGAAGEQDKARIVVNLGKEGKVTGKDFQVLETDEAIKNYILKSKEEILAAGLTPKLHLRGENEILFKESRKVISIASGAGVTQVVFAAFGAPKIEPKPVEEIPQELPDGFIFPRDQDLGMALPSNEPKQPGKEVFIHLNVQGQVFLGKEKTPLDKDADNREMPLLKAELEKLKAGGETLALQIYVEPATVQQRVIDLLNTLAAVNITNVSFIDLIEPEGGKK